MPGAFLRTTVGWLFLLNTFYSVRRPQPQNVILDLCYFPIIIYEHFQSKHCKSLRETDSGSSRQLAVVADKENDAFKTLLKIRSSHPVVSCKKVSVMQSLFRKTVSFHACYCTKRSPSQESFSLCNFNSTFILF